MFENVNSAETTRQRSSTFGDNNPLRFLIRRRHGTGPGGKKPGRSFTAHSSGSNSADGSFLSLYHQSDLRGSQKKQKQATVLVMGERAVGKKTLITELLAQWKKMNLTNEHDCAAEDTMQLSGTHNKSLRFLTVDTRLNDLWISIDCAAYFLVYSKADTRSFRAVEKCLNRVAGSKVPANRIWLIGTHTDLPLNGASIADEGCPLWLLTSQIQRVAQKQKKIHTFELNARKDCLKHLITDIVAAFTFDQQHSRLQKIRLDNKVTQRRKISRSCDNLVGLYNKS